MSLPSTLITPPVTDAGIASVWPDMVSGLPPGVSVVLPRARLVGFPVKANPAIVYVENSALRGPVPVFVEVPAFVTIFGAGKTVGVPSTSICPLMALVGKAIV